MRLTSFINRNWDDSLKLEKRENHRILFEQNNHKNYLNGGNGDVVVDGGMPNDDIDNRYVGTASISSINLIYQSEYDVGYCIRLFHKTIDN